MESPTATVLVDDDRTLTEGSNVSLESTTTGATRTMPNWGRAMAVIAATWLLGTLAVGVVVEFQGRADQTRRAQTLLAQMRNQEGSERVLEAYDGVDWVVKQALNTHVRRGEQVEYTQTRVF